MRVRVEERTIEERGKERLESGDANWMITEG